MEPTHIRLEVNLRAADVVRARLELFLRRLGLACLTWGVVAAAGAYLMSRNAAGLGLLTAAAVIVGPVAVLVLAVVWNAFRQYQASSNAEPMRYCFHDDGIDVGSSRKAGWIPWEAFTAAVETSSAFLIFFEGDHHYLVPKASFPGPNEIDAVRKLLAANMHR